jgi:hypothetical protein
VNLKLLAGLIVWAMKKREPDCLRHWVHWQVLDCYKRLETEGGSTFLERQDRGTDRALKVVVGGKVDAVAEAVAEAAAGDELGCGERGSHGVSVSVIDLLKCWSCSGFLERDANRS